MNDMLKTPELLFESSWEVCNKVGGIYTVLSTKAHTLQQIFNDKVIFIGPDVWADTVVPDFQEEVALFADWKRHAEEVDHLRVKVGRWNVPGTPPVILVDFKPYFSERDAFFYAMWDNFRVDSIHAYGDYDESCIFAYAVGKVIESFYHFYKLENKRVAALFNEWMLGMGALYVRKHIPAIAHDARYVDRPFHRGQQQGPVRVYGWLQWRPDGEGAEHGGQAFRGEADRSFRGLLHDRERYYRTRVQTVIG